MGSIIDQITNDLDNLKSGGTGNTSNSSLKKLQDQVNTIQKDLDDTEKSVTTLTTGVNQKANLTYVNAELGKKAKQADLDSTNVALTEKAKKTDGVISITEFDNLVLNKGQANEDWKDAFEAAKNFLLNSSNVNKLVFPSGIYQYSVSPNWAIQDVQIVADGEVRLRYTGTSHAVILDGSGNVLPVASNVFNMEFRGFIVEATSTSVHGVYVHAVHHSRIEVRVSGCGNAGLYVLFAVCSEFWITVSGNEEGWYQNARPFAGILLDQMSSGLLPSYCTFHNPIIEGTVQGGLLNATLGNTFIGGTFEGCLDSGLTLNSNAGLNKFFSVDLEANTGQDIVCGGFENIFYAIDSSKMAVFQATSKNNTINGGSFKNITLESGSSFNLIDSVVYNRELYDGTTGTITDAGTNNRIVNARNMKGGTWYV